MRLNNYISSQMEQASINYLPVSISHQQRRQQRLIKTEAAETNKPYHTFTAEAAEADNKNANVDNKNTNVDNKNTIILTSQV